MITDLKFKSIDKTLEICCFRDPLLYQFPKSVLKGSLLLYEIKNNEKNRIYDVKENNGTIDGMATS